jgi:hypothetical protein
MTSLVYGKRCLTYENSEAEKYFLGIKLFNETNDPGAYPPIELLPWLKFVPRWLAPVGLSLYHLVNTILTVCHSVDSALRSHEERSRYAILRPPRRLREKS